MNIGWPEGLWLFLMALNLLATAHLHGKSKAANTHNFPGTAVGSIIMFGWLYWGGFFA